MNEQEKPAFNIDAELNSLEFALWMTIILFCAIGVVFIIFSRYPTLEVEAKYPVEEVQEPIPHVVEDHPQSFDVRLEAMVDTLEKAGYTCSQTNREIDQ